MVLQSGCSIPRQKEIAAPRINPGRPFLSGHAVQVGLDRLDIPALSAGCPNASRVRHLSQSACNIASVAAMPEGCPSWRFSAACPNPHRACHASVSCDASSPSDNDPLLPDGNSSPSDKTWRSRLISPGGIQSRVPPNARSGSLHWPAPYEPGRGFGQAAARFP